MRTFYVYCLKGTLLGTLDALDHASAMQLAEVVYGPDQFLETQRRLTRAA